MNSAIQYKLFATCPKSLEELLFQELTDLGANNVKMTVAGVHFSGDLKLAYSVCLWSRLASRVLLEMASFECQSEEDLYKEIYAIDWSETFPIHQTFAISVRLRRAFSDHSIYVAQKVKDALVDRYRDDRGVRPSVDKDNPDLQWNLFCNQHQAQLYLDLSGTSLHQRGYRTGTGAAPMKENLAAAVLLRAGWPQVAAAGGDLVDPLCGSGTLLVEAAMMAWNQAPGLLRKRWGFTAWKAHQPLLWAKLIEEARDKVAQSRMTFQGELFGFEKSGRVLDLAEENIRRAGVSEIITLKKMDLANNQHQVAENSLVVTNPPYGERLDERIQALQVFGELGDWLKRCAIGAKAAYLAIDKDMGRATGIRSDKFYHMFNGQLSIELCCSKVIPENFSQSAYTQSVTELSTGGRELSNRLAKNDRKLKSWLKKEGIECYRLYDADLPEYNVAIDRYGRYFHVQEYAAPRTIPPQTARKRLDEVVLVIRERYQVSVEEICIKRRRKQKNEDQYQKQELLSAVDVEPFTVYESGLRFEVDLGKYVDTGLFLDSRPMRRLVAQHAAKKSLLNLFAYTGTASVYAAAAGAASTTTVDMSNTYIAWAERNMKANGFTGSNHHFIQQDCIQWLMDNTLKYDVIFLDPPTFSNSKSMETHWDVQEDHGIFIEKLMESLDQDGLMIFSNNLRKFKLDEELAEIFDVENISDKTFDPDFQRNRHIHHCFLIRHKKVVG